MAPLSSTQSGGMAAALQIYTPAILATVSIAIATSAAP